MAQIYITHCSHKKNDEYRDRKKTALAVELYTARPTQRFMKRCSVTNVRWAIFSDLYGIWFPEIKHKWYEKDPNTVTEAEFSALLKDFDQKLESYSEIYFYYNPGRFHPLYARLLKDSVLANRVKRITHLRDIS